jgi:hypothetical protein
VLIASAEKVFNQSKAPKSFGHSTPVLLRSIKPSTTT